MEIQIYFNILTLPSIALKRWNFPENLGFENNTVAKFLIKSIFSQYNMTIKQRINHGTIQKVCHLHDRIFRPIHLSHTLSILLFHLPCDIHLEWEKRKLFVYMAAPGDHIISKEIDNRIFRHIRLFRHTYIYKQPTTYVDKIVESWNFCANIT